MAPFKAAVGNPLHRIRYDKRILARIALRQGTVGFPVPRFPQRPCRLLLVAFPEIQLRHRMAVDVCRDHQTGSVGGDGSHRSLFPVIEILPQHWIFPIAGRFAASLQIHGHRFTQRHAIPVFLIIFLRHVLQPEVGGRIRRLLPQDDNHLSPGGKLPFLCRRGDPRAAGSNRRQLPEFIGHYHSRIAAFIPDAPVVRIGRNRRRRGKICLVFSPRERQDQRILFHENAGDKYRRIFPDVCGNRGAGMLLLVHQPCGIKRRPAGSDQRLIGFCQLLEGIAPLSGDISAAVHAPPEKFQQLVADAADPGVVHHRLRIGDSQLHAVFIGVVQHISAGI